MSAPWLKASTTLLHDSRVLALPSDACRWTWMLLLLHAKLQTPQGEFDSRGQVESLLGRDRKRWVDVLLGADLAREVEDGRIVIPRWASHQVDPTGADRQRRWREREAERNVTVTPTVTSRNGPDNVTVTRGDRDGDRDTPPTPSRPNGAPTPRPSSRGKTTKLITDPKELDRINAHNQGVTRQTRAALLASGQVKPTKPGDEELLSEYLAAHPESKPRPRPRPRADQTPTKEDAP